MTLEKITPSMEAAGETALEWFRETYPDRELVRVVYAAMVAAKYQPNLSGIEAARLAEASIF